ncbi:SDR family oxidoreductase [Rhodococcus sp. IEGM 1366]|uniref:SDR family NAD(P)-dependent oxidoreductase n=1 Tax=Rhodococcus sp. IEGM 1366 TaxID=3082223 RepID=UPI002954853D|nr:SDR family oxidoreductase [Rhodococcus sp. IEGM 1366]MDV8071469.1 SDR family oxidoreductase [Rhodococcus sp. IEGM 1366]
MSGNTSDLTGHVAVVTGGSTGIGRAIVDGLHLAGSKVAVLDRDPVENTDSIIGIQLDVRDENAVREAMRHVADKWGRLDILVTAAGGGSGDLDDNCASELSSEALSDALVLNLFGTVHACVAASPYFKAQQSGSIVTIGSINGMEATAHGSYAHYGTAKAAVAAYTTYLAQDLAPHGVRANLVAPGPISTARLATKYAEQGKDQGEGIPFGRPGTPEEIANTVLFLASPATPFLTGATIAVHGGLIRSI